MEQRAARQGDQSKRHSLTVLKSKRMAPKHNLEIMDFRDPCETGNRFYAVVSGRSHLLFA